MKRKEMNILHYNCRGLASEERLQEFENALQEIKWDIVGLAEVRREGENLIKRRNGNYFYFYGETKGYRGVGFYVRKGLAKDIIEIKGITERVGVLKIRIEKKVAVTIVQVYAPTSEKTEEEVDEFYKVVEETIRENKEHYCIVMGDWNSKVGKGEEIQGVKGPYGLGEMNERGKRMVEFAMRNNLKLTASFYKKKENRKWTWESPDGKTKNEIDHALINDMRITKDVDIIAKFKFSSDHRITRIKVVIPRRNRIRNLIQKDEAKKIIPIEKNEETIEFINNEIEKEEAKGKVKMQEYYNVIEKSIKEAVEIFGKVRSVITTDDKLTKETKGLIKKRERKDIKTYEEKQICEIIEESRSTKKVWKEINQGQKLLVSLKNKEGKVETNRIKMITAATEFYEQLYGRDKEENESEENEKENIEMRDEEDEEEKVPRILEREVEWGIRNLKLGKAPGPDEIENKMIKEFEMALVKPLTKLYNMILEEEKTPKQWEVSELMLIHKKRKER